MPCRQDLFSFETRFNLLKTNPVQVQRVVFCREAVTTLTHNKGGGYEEVDSHS